MLPEFGDMITDVMSSRHATRTPASHRSPCLLKAPSVAYWKTLVESKELL